MKYTRQRSGTLVRMAANACVIVGVIGLATLIVVLGRGESLLLTLLIPIPIVHGVGGIAIHWGRLGALWVELFVTVSAVIIDMPIVLAIPRLFPFNFFAGMGIPLAALVLMAIRSSDELLGRDSG